LKTGKYNYRLKQIDLNGNYEFYNLQNEIVISLPKKFSISQNYPNPFNPVTKIDFDLPNDCNVSIKLYDITGREIKTLLNERKNAGYYTIDFTANNIASGVYFYRIVAGSYSEIKKMVLIK
ncbi:MAG: T9SS type A sorting domain-containing protein, partial [Ignavibacteriae bacterium]|nr:T9SS type A sorting domain-containing protein [Ignavibacteriota bacterium]